MSKLKQEKMPVDVIMTEWKLVRESDELTKTSEKVTWVEWNEDGRFKAQHSTPLVGLSLLMSPFNQFFTWQTTPITEILYAEENGSVRFRTKNSVYTLTKIHNESNTEL